MQLSLYAAPEWRSLATILGLAFLGVVFEALFPWPLKLIMDHVLTERPLPSGAEWIGSLPGATTSTGLLGWLAAAALMAFVAGQAVQVLKSLVQADVAGRMQYRCAGDVFEHLQTLSLEFHARAHKGDLVRRVAIDTGCVPALVTRVIVPLVTALLTLAVLLTIMWRMDAVLALVALGVALPLGFLLRHLGPRMTERGYQYQQLEAEVWNVAEQTLTALPVVQAFGREDYERSRFEGISGRSIRAYMRSIASQLQFRVGVDGTLALGTAAVMLIGGLQVLRGTSSLGSLIVFFSYLTALYAPLVIVAYASSMFANAVGNARRVIDLLNARDRIHDHLHARPLANSRVAAGHVQLEGIVFGYGPGRPVLRGMSVEALPGETVALVGATGAGKTTLVSLIPRLFDPWEGRVLIDGQDVRTATLLSVRQCVALVLQDPFLLPISIADNIAYGRPGASREAVIAAAIAANADEFIRKLPHSYDHVIGERGATLSAGQRQRIAISRALLKDAPILILDEPTAAMDANTEVLVMDAIERLTRGRTTFLIAHRLSTVRRANRIIVLEAGRVVEMGTHDELLARTGAYRRLHAAM